MGTPSVGKRSPPHRQHPSYHDTGNHRVHGAKVVTGAMDTRRTVGAALPAAARVRSGGVLLEAPVRFGSLSLTVDAEGTGHAAREMVRVTLTAWELGWLCDDVQLCVSELVGNVVLHSVPDDRRGWPASERMLTLTLRAWPGWLFAEVGDADSSAPTLPSGDGFGPDLAEDLPEALLPDHGRGLHLVRSLSDHVWWAPRDEGGKSVLCRFDLTGAAL